MIGRIRGESSGKVVTVQRILEEDSAVINVVEEVSGAVVSVITRTVILDPFRGPSEDQSGIGTGFIVDGKQGLIITNRHVVSGSGQYSVVLTDGETTYEVSEVHRDPVYDLAILKLNLDDNQTLPQVELGDSDNLKVGQTVIAIGNALGKLGNTVTKGVVSALGRGITASSGFFGPQEFLEDVIQTDAALNPGNSGGPLLNLLGQVVGINVAISSGAENIGFAIPIDSVKPVIEEFVRTGRIIRPLLGVEYAMISPATAQLRRLPEGAFIQTVVPDSSAAEAGLKAGDIITEFGGEKVTEKNSLAKIIRKHRVGEKVTIVIDRAGEVKTLTATLKEAPQRE